MKLFHHLQLLLIAMLIFTSASVFAQDIELQFLGRYSTGIFDDGASEIVDYWAGSQTVYSTNANANTVDAVSISDPTNPTLTFSIDLSSYGAGVNSLKVLNDGIAIAVEAAVKQDPGSIVFFDHAGNFLNQLTVGALPDMVTVTNDGNKLLVANEGEPNDDYTVDPMGSVSIIDLSAGLANLTASDVTTLDFTAYNGGIAGARIFGPGATVAMDMEPENIAVSDDNSTAWVVCQENNVLAIIDLTTDSWSSIAALGTKDHNLPGNGMDASNQDDGINIQNWPVLGYYLPDALDAYSVGGIDYVITANEGDSRDYDGFSEEERVKDLQYDLDDNGINDDLDDNGMLDESTLFYDDTQLGRLKVTSVAGDIDNDGMYEEIYSYGARSFSIWDANGNLVWDSGDDFEQILAAELPDDFNSNNDENDSFDSRSDDKGPEPEAVEIAEIDGKFYAFIGLERVGGIMVYDVTDPNAPEYIQYINSRDFSGDLETNGTDSGVENLRFVDASVSPTGKNLLVASNEVSGTISLFEVGTAPYRLQMLHASDLEGGVDAISRAPNFAAIVDKLEDEYDNTIVLSAGDNYIPGPFYNAAADGSMRPVFQDVYQDLFGEPGLTNIREGAGRADISIMNIIGFDASAVGNHEFDATPDTFESIIEENITGADLGSVRWLGAEFPYLSCNLDFTNDGDLANLYTADILPNTDFQSTVPLFENNTPKLAPATTITRGGEVIGVVGATTQLLETITSNGGVSVIGGSGNDMAVLASLIQPVIDDLQSMGINKIILVSHLQQIALEQELVGLLSGVDIVVAGGSDAILADDNDRLDNGDVAAFTYPLISADLNGDSALIVSTDGEYNYVGRLVVDFDEEGKIITESLDDTINGPYIADEQMVNDVWTGMGDPFATLTKGELVSRLVNAVEGIVIVKDGNVFGKTAVYLDGRKSEVRSEETNMGNLTADANLWTAQSFDPTVQVSLKNGGGIRAAIGEVVEISPGNYQFLPPQANPLSGKEETEVSQLDIENTLRFNNGLTLLDLSASDFLTVIEHGLAGAAPNAAPGSFPQVSGMKVIYDINAAAGSRVRYLAIIDENGIVQDEIVNEGELMGDSERNIRIVTLDFLAGGGDGYPYPDLGENFVQLEDVLPGAGDADFADAGSEQDALAEYLFAEFSVEPYNEAETEPMDDMRIMLFNNGITTPENDNQEGAIVNTPDRLWGVPGWDTFDVFGATLSDESCTGEAVADTWYSFVAQAENQGILVRVNPADPNAATADLAVEMYDAELNPLEGMTLGTLCPQSRTCFNNYGPGEIERCVPTDLVIGDTYYYRVYDATGGDVSMLDTKVKTFASHPIIVGCNDPVGPSLDQYITAAPNTMYNIPPVPVVAVRLVALDEDGNVVATTASKNPAGTGTLSFQFFEFLQSFSTGSYTIHAQHRIKMMANGCVSTFWSQVGEGCPREVGMVSAPSSNGEGSLTSLSISVFPNPNRGDQVYVRMENMTESDQNMIFEIFDMYGKKVHSERFVHAENEIKKLVVFDQKLSSGLYFVRLSVNDKTTTQKLIIE